LADAPAERYDAIVVGSGVAGALIAWKLAEVGRNVLILEAGEQGPSRAELVKKYAAATNTHVGLENKLRTLAQGSQAVHTLTRDIASAASIREAARKTIHQHETAVHGAAATASNIDC